MYTAGPQLLEECRTLNGCEVGQAKITKGYNLPAKYVIHTVGPIWRGGNYNEEKLLSDCYKNSLKIAKEYNLESIAFPLISTGAYGYPVDKGLKVAISVIGDFLLNNDIKVYLVVYNKDAFKISEKLFSSIRQYIDDRYVKEHIIERYNIIEKDIIYNKEQINLFAETAVPSTKKKRSLEDVVNELDETFTQMLLRLIDEKGLTDAQVYKRANVDRRLFSKIRSDINYKPSKSTAIAFAIALHLNLDETKDLLSKAGYALSHSNKFDIIIEYFIKEENYNVFEINEALFAFEQNLLGV
ncbi:O-acetyl-ADP-ribose deacetylase (regulator of RNase III), contains Macro domain [Caloramator quimbayensis]|uniref:O-acetyl-ADP-ribose deacetylase (Regulator of RNase III), contains Macro domain n=1 Tax=Caloramator quimbayensis TaxID=1147123 RepID=A0A1T4XDV9_9CLOT|nr:macro domain-containing protein [Caloramator quimbayensis]SKA87730.1 O-acetyl-ADP-ribose deacetylase (regulator of RNase III), contains Macro domain [Caloramator quimbayensis]